MTGKVSRKYALFAVFITHKASVSTIHTALSADPEKMQKAMEANMYLSLSGNYAS
jgi:hypothetical protein